MRKPAEQVHSREQLVTANHHWDRVHGVRVENGTVTIDTDRSHSNTYPVGTTVGIVDG